VRCCIQRIRQVSCAGNVWRDTHRRESKSSGAYIHDVTLLTLFTVHVRSCNLKRMHDRPLESSHALLPLAHHASTVAKNCLLRIGRAMWYLDGRGNGSDRNKMRQPHTMDPIWQDLSQLRKSLEGSPCSPNVLTTVHSRQTAG